MPEVTEEFQPGDPACGQKTCPFFHNEKSAMDNDFLTPPKGADCGNRTCPFKGDLLKPIELQTNPPNFGTVHCGSPLCRVPKKVPEKELQPIHWECDEPLPHGPCKNPDCPIEMENRKNAELLLELSNSRPPSSKPKNRCSFTPSPPTCYTAPSSPACHSPRLVPSRPPSAPSKGRCCGGGSTTGCYPPPPVCSPPPPVCSYPPCPLNSPPKTCHVVLGPCGSFDCPYKPASPPCCGDPDVEPCMDPSCPFTPVSKCGNPECPFREDAKEKPCPNPKCPSKPPPRPPCGNPDCPYTGEPVEDYCGSPTCPFKPPPPTSPFCGNPECPFNPPNDDFCPNPECPSKQPEDDFCGNPECPFKPPKDDFCANPECPFKQPKDDFCGNPSCPFRPPLSGGDHAYKCGNPQCPFNEPSCHDPPVSPCGVPACPYKPAPPPSCNDPNIDPCLDPSCPFAPKIVCSNPRCPFNPGPPQCPLCDSNSPYLEPKDEVCTSPNCPFTPRPKGDDGKIGCDNKEKPCSKATCKWLNEYVKCGKCKGLSKSGATCDNPHPAPAAPLASEEAMPAGSDSQVKKSSNMDQKSNAKSADNASTSGKKRKPSLSDAKEKKADSAGKDTKESSKTHVGAAAPSDKTEVAKGKKGHSENTGKEKKQRSNFVYDCGDDYPGVKVGHRDCIAKHGLTIPTNMGWLWNIRDQYGNLKPRGTGWRPGAMAKVISERIRKHREAHGCEMLNLFGKFVGKKSKKPMHVSNSNISIPDKPTLHVKKTKGVYMITMNPLKDPLARKLEENESPYLDCTPMQFKIVKNKDKLTLLNGDEGEEQYKNCMCGAEEDDDAQSSESELEIEFTPPAGIIHPEMRKRKHSVVHTDTQYDVKDCVLPKKKEAAKHDGKEKGKKGKGKGGKGGGKGAGKGAKGKKK